MRAELSDIYLETLHRLWIWIPQLVWGQGIRAKKHSVDLKIGLYDCCFKTSACLCVIIGGRVFSRWEDSITFKRIVYQ